MDYTLYQFVFRIREDDGGLERFSLLKFHGGVRDYDNNIPYLGFSRGRSVEADHPCATFALYYVRVESLTIIDVDNLYFFTFNNVGSLHQIFINSNAADVVELRMSDLHPVNF